MVPRGGQRAWLSVSDFILYFLIFSAIVDRRNVVLSLGFDGIPGDYCRVRRPEQCCRSRDDDCTAPILGNHLCYCDIFCREHPGNDCCPDFGPVCEGIQPPPTATSSECVDNEGRQYSPGSGQQFQWNCNTCTCSADGRRNCDDVACMIQEDLLNDVNQGRYTWRGYNYTDFWGKTLDSGIKFRLGTLYPERSVQNMNEILIEVDRSLPARFDAREKWPNYIHPVRNQENCGSSWAFSTTAVSADRLAIQSNGKFNAVLSPQQLLSCNQHRQKGCEGGYLDRAWWYIRKLGVVSEQCYPYESGRTNQPGACKIPQTQYRRGETINCPSGDSENRVYKMTPPYRVSTKEEEIMTEIFVNGPVQATFLVHEDFYMYQSGVYKHEDLARSKAPQFRKSGYHSVRILGWGEENSVKFWLCDNSWGTGWGENGLFKILRGENHCEIESFVLGAWGKGSKRRRRRFRIRKVKKRLRKLLAA